MNNQIGFLIVGTHNRIEGNDAVENYNYGFWVQGTHANVGLRNRAVDNGGFGAGDYSIGGPPPMFQRANEFPVITDADGATNPWANLR
jgi:parallel beta-helix repeat protein